jgi:predicted Zn-ribbon and HTH transcriptional regulator
MQVAHRTVQRCRVCGFAELRTDEVVDRGLVWLSECPRCEDRSTAAPGASRRARAAAKVVREVAPAA